MLRIAATSRRLAPLRSLPGTLRLFHHSVVLAEKETPENEDGSPLGTKSPRRRGLVPADSIDTSTINETAIPRKIGRLTSVGSGKSTDGADQKTAGKPGVKARAIKTEAVDHVPKRRGRKPKLTAPEATPKVPKRRGPKPRLKEAPSMEGGRKPIIDSLKGDGEVSEENIREPLNLRNTLAGLYAHKGGGRYKRMNVVSESLCDDIIKRMEPTLEQHKGCDIIDINPGAGVFSSKLHDHLKPRTHILMEPDHMSYRRFLQPLLDDLESNYTLVPKSGIIWGYMEKILSERYLPHQKPLAVDDPRLHQPNPSLLVVANLGYQPKKPYRGFPSLAQMVIYQFLSAIKSHSLFHRYGLVRMLIWINDDEKTAVIPRSIRYRRKAAVELEIVCHSATEVASSTSSERVSVARGDSTLDLEGMRQVMKRMEEKGIKTPPGRESVLMNELIRGPTESKKEFDPTALAMEGHLGEVSMDEHAIVSAPDGSEIVASKIQQWRINNSRQALKRLRTLSDEYMAILALEKDLSNRPTRDDAPSIEEEITRRHAAWDEAYENLADDQKNIVWSWVDNARSFHDEILVWDRREFEPLRASHDEFYPTKEMALIDLQPTTQWSVLRKNDAETDEILEYILARLFISPRTSMKKGLKALWPGAFEWLTEHCPSLTDPNKGGCRDLDKLPARLITPEMVKEILEAWLEWPWRPSRWDIMAQLGSVSYDPDAIEQDE